MTSVHVTGLYDVDCLDDNGEDNPNCTVLYCVVCCTTAVHSGMHAHMGSSYRCDCCFVFRFILSVFCLFLS